MVQTAEKLVKHGRFAHSGVYQYSAQEIPRLGLSWPAPAEIGDKAMYAVYRPAPVLVSAVKDGLFTRMTLTRQHPSDWVMPDNWRDVAIGMTGDTASIEWVDDEVSVNGSMTIADEVGVEAYDQDVIDLSPGYSASFVWRKGTHKDQSYDAVMVSVDATNHLALVDHGRGGILSTITDAAVQVKARARKIASGLWWAVRRRTLVLDDYSGGDPVSASTGFRSGLESLCKSRMTLNDTEIHSRVEQLRLLLVDLPSSDQRELLMRYMDDLKLMKVMPEQSVYEAIDLACSLFDNLDGDAINEVSYAFGEGETHGKGTSHDAKGAKMTLAELLGGGKKKTPVPTSGAKVVTVADMEVTTTKKESPAAPSGDCSDCHGTGLRDGLKCSTCDGTGKVTTVDAPPSVEAPTKSANIADPVSAPARPELAPPVVKGPEIPVVSANIEGVTDEPDPAVPSAVPGATPLASPSPAPQQPPSPSPEGVPTATPAAPAPGTQGGPAYWVGQIADLLTKMMADPAVQALKTPPPASAPPAAASPAGPPPADAPPAAKGTAPPVAEPKGETPPNSTEPPKPAVPAETPQEKKNPPPAAKDAAIEPGDPASSLTALLSPSTRVDDGAPQGLDGLVSSILNKGRKQ